MKATSLVLAIFLGSADALEFRPYVNGRTPWYTQPPRGPKDDHPVDYPVPNFGQDKDIRDTMTHTDEAESRLKHKWVGATFKKPKGHPIDYFVPNFGKDKDIVTTQNNLKEAETTTGHTWLSASFKPPKSHPVDYYVPNFGMDRDVENTLSHVSNMEKKYKHKFHVPTKAE